MNGLLIHFRKIPKNKPKYDVKNSVETPIAKPTNLCPISWRMIPGAVTSAANLKSCQLKDVLGVSTLLIVDGLLM